MDRITFLSYLSHCSSSTGPHHIEAEDDVATEVNGQISISLVADPLEPHDLEYNNIKFVLANIAEIWQPLAKLGCTSELLTVLRQWASSLAPPTTTVSAPFTACRRNPHSPAPLTPHTALPLWQPLPPRCY
ncbi:hypothetical protein E3N88_33575 [Mikania micrantha]|uniref:Uncharacterized protein n=1 Tax=Mikania micrantha TaxID=192012 RepID=A0A5N6MBT8_9ASTR|nr:hypothetical protein E3N88_33575 [Mikania micrantha]